MTVYLLHFARRYNTRATTSATDLDVRLAQHAAGQGARLLAAAKCAGIGWELERQLKKQLGAPGSARNAEPEIERAVVQASESPAEREWLEREVEAG